MQPPCECKVLEEGLLHLVACMSPGLSMVWSKQYGIGRALVRAYLTTVGM